MWKLDPILVPWKLLPTLLFMSAILLWWYYKCHVWVASYGKWNFKSFPQIFLVELSLPKKTLQGYLRQELNVQYLDSLFEASNIYVVLKLSWQSLRNGHLILLCTFGNVPSDLGFDITVKRPWQFKVTLLSNHLSLNLFQWEEILSQIIQHWNRAGWALTMIELQYKAAAQGWHKLICWLCTGVDE